jgi:hypothetical protein
MANQPTQSALENIRARTIRVGDINQTITYNQPAQALSTTVNNWRPPVQGAWQARSEEQTISNYLTNTQVRLVGIYGAGGFGKSALGRRCFDRLKDLVISCGQIFRNRQILGHLGGG